MLLPVLVILCFFLRFYDFLSTLVYLFHPTVCVSFFKNSDPLLAFSLHFRWQQCQNTSVALEAGFSATSLCSTAPQMQIPHRCADNLISPESHSIKAAPTFSKTNALFFFYSAHDWPLQDERNTRGALLIPINELMCLLKNDSTVDSNVHSNKTHGDKNSERCYR